MGAGGGDARACIWIWIGSALIPHKTGDVLYVTLHMYAYMRILYPEMDSMDEIGKG